MFNGDAHARVTGAPRESCKRVAISCITWQMAAAGDAQLELRSGLKVIKDFEDLKLVRFLANFLRDELLVRVGPSKHR